MLKPKTNYQLFNLIIDFVYKDNTTGSPYVAADISQSKHLVKQPRYVAADISQSKHLVKQPRQ